MRALLLFTIAALVTVSTPGRAAACGAPPVPVYPGARQTAGLVSSAVGGATGEGHTIWTTPAASLDILMFYYANLPADGWTPVAQLPGQYPDQFASMDAGGVTAPSVLEFSRARDAEHVVIVPEATGYSVWLECRD